MTVVMSPMKPIPPVKLLLSTIYTGFLTQLFSSLLALASLPGSLELVSSLGRDCRHREEIAGIGFLLFFISWEVFVLFWKSKARL